MNAYFLEIDNDYIIGEAIIIAHDLEQAQGKIDLMPYSEGGGYTLRYVPDRLKDEADEYLAANQACIVILWSDMKADN